MIRHLGQMRQMRRHLGQIRQQTWHLAPAVIPVIAPAALAPIITPVAATPVAATPAADDTVIIDNEAAPLAAGLGEGGEGIIIGDEEVPLAPSPEEVACCILHLIIMCGAMLVEMYYFHDRKKRKEDEREVRLELGR